MTTEEIPSVRHALLCRLIVCGLLSTVNVLLHVFVRLVVWELFGQDVVVNTPLLRFSSTVLIGAMTYLAPVTLVLGFMRNCSPRYRYSAVVWTFRAYLVMWVGLSVWLWFVFANFGRL
jgi:hypothetical protein